MDRTLYGAILPWMLLSMIFFPGSIIGADDPSHKTEGPEATGQAEDRMKWWREGRFGLFIHWGPVSLKGTEISWSRANSNPLCPNHGPIPVEVYDAFYKDFNPAQFDASEWAGIARDAGARYVVLTAKHCDGFCLWPTKTIDYHIGNSPFGRDVCQELADAVREAGLRIGWYYSPMDWRDPDCRTERNTDYVRRMQGQIRELLGNYGRIDVMWFDWDGKTIPWDQDNTYRMVRALQPRIIINNRLDCSFGGLTARRDIGANADYYTPEQTIGVFDDQRPWETCMTIGTQWSWKPNDQIKSEKECIQTLIKCAGGDGNLLFNVGPMPSGEIEPRQVERLKAMGRWLGRYGQAIYATRGGPYKPGSWGACTNRGKSVFLHIMNWYEDSLTLPVLPLKIVSGRLLNGGAVKVQQDGDGVHVSVPHEDREEIATVIELKLDGPAGSIPAQDVVFTSLMTGKKVTASNVYQNNSTYGPDKALDGNESSRWATDSGVRAAWLQVDMGGSVTVDRAFISEGWNRTQAFELQYEHQGEWISFAKGGQIGSGLTLRFPPVEVKIVRLNISDASDGPTLYEFRLFEAKR